ncbi:putative mitochondrial protein [Cocos nucifera]|uniref:Putative mitochondrial protein n=1 Tax=Cocos nucifera TaxID=13894 RepID=A0A8K0IAJ2_COCNU|nr:putative mitochondrial protein [Cocos nucifera]
MQSDRAPGPLGFQPLFFKYFWSTIRNEVLAAIQEVFSLEKMPRQWKTTYIVLILKKENPRDVLDYRPISLCNILYKLMAKLLVNHLKPLIPSLVSAEQDAFVLARNISKNIMVAHEIFHSMSRASPRKSLMIIRADMEKAYDRMSWKFIEVVLGHYGFHSTFIRWIMTCVTHPCFSVIVNGTPSDWFTSSGGLRQGCPLSPFLFILCSDMLSRSLQHLTETGGLRAYEPTNSGLSISHLMFADDLLLVARATTWNARILKQTLMKYCIQSGQQININKSHISFSKRINI